VTMQTGVKGMGFIVLGFITIGVMAFFGSKA
jgi:hypothetical protein